MSGSRRKRPFCSITSSGFRKGEKDEKRLSSRIVRRRVAAALAAGEERPLHDHLEGLDPYGMRKDGKQRFDPVRHPECMRK